MGIDMGMGAAAGHSSSRNGVPLAGMKPTGTYARNSSIASKKLVSKSRRLQLVSVLRIHRMGQCQIGFLSASGKTMKGIRRTQEVCDGAGNRMMRFRASPQPRQRKLWSSASTSAAVIESVYRLPKCVRT